MPTQSDPGDLAELADLDTLADELNRLGFPSLRLSPLGKAPYVDTSQPQGMTPGIRIHTHAGMYFWPDNTPIAPTSQPTTAAALIAHELRSTTHSSQHPNTP